MLGETVKRMLQFDILIVLILITLVKMAASKHCIPGQEIKREESTGKEYCSDCKPGSYSKDGRKCYRCSVCHPGQRKIRSCTSSRNTMCHCLAGMYLKGVTVCRKCSSCRPGWYQTLDCSHNMDRSCRKCPEGLTTNVTNGRVCILIKITPNPPNIVIKHIVDWWIFLFIPILLVLLGFGAAIYYWRLHKKKSNSGHLKSKCNGINNNNINNKHKIVTKTPTEYDPEKCAEHVCFVSDEPSNNLRMVRELKAHLYEELGHKLNNNHPYNWRYLAGLLGFSKEQIRYLELEPLQSTQNLLNDWSSKDGSTVHKLHYTLNNMKRTDAARVIQNYIYR